MRNLQKSTKIFIYCGVAVVLIVSAIMIFKNGNGKQTVAVVRADVVAEVAVTGKIKPNQSVDLGFDMSGRIGAVHTEMGYTVKKNQILVSLESGEISANLAKAKADFFQETIKLGEIENTAPIYYGDAAKNLDAAVRKSFADADNAVRNKADQFFKNIPDNPYFEISITSGGFIHYFSAPTDLVLEINSDRKKIEEILKSWQTADEAVKNLRIISDFLDKMALAVNSFVSSDYTYDVTVNNYKTVISGARSDVAEAIAAIVTAKDKLNAAPARSLGGEFDNILVQKAVVSGAEATVASLEATLAKSEIRAPFDGIITKQEAKLGATVSPGEKLVSMSNQEQIFVEANISEIHIGKIAIGNLAVVSFDAFPNEIFFGEVYYIEPSETIIDGIVNYKIRVNLENSDQKIKNGLTANLKIETAKKENVLTLPLYAVSEENGQNFVNKIMGGKTQKTPIVLGLRGSSGFVEILGGLTLGDNVEF